MQDPGQLQRVGRLERASERDALPFIDHGLQSLITGAVRLCVVGIRWHDRLDKLRQEAGLCSACGDGQATKGKSHGQLLEIEHTQVPRATVDVIAQDFSELIGRHVSDAPRTVVPRTWPKGTFVLALPILISTVAGTTE
jgi:hypothetical protein